MAMEQMKTLTINTDQYEIVDEAARNEIESIHDVISNELNDFVGASSSTSGKHGFVPAPQSSDTSKFLRGDGKWDYASSPETETRLSDLEEMTSELGTSSVYTQNLIGNHVADFNNPHKLSLDTFGIEANEKEINILRGATLTTNELNTLDGITVTAQELNTVKNAKSNLQSQVDNRIPFNNVGSIDIVENDDLNNFVTPGIYISDGAEISRKVLNSPTDLTGFKMFVVSGYVAARVTQFVTTNTDDIYYRQFNGTIWTDWVTPYTNLNVPALNDCNGILSVDKGGTGGSTSFEARSNIGIYTGYIEPDEAEDGDIFFKLSTGGVIL